MMSFLSTRQVAKLLGITPACLTKALWDGRVDPPQKAPSGSYLWTLRDIEKASWALRRRAFKPPADILAMVNPGLSVA